MPRGASAASYLFIMIMHSLLFLFSCLVNSSSAFLLPSHGVQRRHCSSQAATRALIVPILRTTAPIFLCAPAEPVASGSESGGRGRSGGARGRGGGRARGRGGGGRGRGRGGASGGGRGGGRAAPAGGGGPRVKVRYLKEAEMQDLVREAALSQGFEATQALMLASCARNIYAIGCNYQCAALILHCRLVPPTHSDSKSPCALSLSRAHAARARSRSSRRSAVSRRSRASRGQSCCSAASRARCRGCDRPKPRACAWLRPRPLLRDAAREGSKS